MRNNMLTKTWNCLKQLKFSEILLYCFLVLLIVTPRVHISNLPFSVHISDLMFPLILFSIIRNKWYKQTLPFIIAAGISLIIVVSIMINREYGDLANFYEVYKIIKIAACFIFFKNLLPDVKIKYCWDIIFIFLVVFNLFNYFNIFSFNTIIMPFYCEDTNLNLIYFEYNRLGMPISKRMIGVLGNPNDNAILFCFFAVLYAPYKKMKIKNISFFLIAVAGMLACQSRTTMVAFIAFWIAYCLFTTLAWKKKAILSAAVILLSFICIHCGKMQYLSTMFTSQKLSEEEINLNIKAFKTYSWTGRKDIWRFLVLENQTPKTILLGHSPDKQFIYSKEIYFESQYVSIFYKYGLVGLLAIMTIFVLPFIRAFKRINRERESFRYWAMLIIIAVVSITNCPFYHPVLVLLFIYMLAQFYTVVPYPNFIRLCRLKKQEFQA